MKKLVLFGAAVVALCFAGCSGSDANKAENEGFDSLFTQAQGDSLVEAFGRAFASNVSLQLFYGPRADSTLSKAQVLKGMQYILAADTTQSYTIGVQVGMTMIQQIKRMEQQGVVVDRNKLLSAFRSTFNNDTLNDEMGRTYMNDYQALEGALKTAQRKYEHAKLEQSRDAQINAALGKQYIDSIAAADNIAVSSTGVATKIITPGTGEKVKKTDRVDMRYTVKTAKGRIIEQVAADPRPVKVSTRPEGFQEGVTQLAKGGKAVIYVPGAMAYGVEDMRNRYGLGLNEMVIYEVEIVDIPQSK